MKKKEENDKPQGLNAFSLVVKHEATLSLFPSSAKTNLAASCVDFKKSKRNLLIQFDLHEHVVEMRLTSKDVGEQNTKKFVRVEDKWLRKSFTQPRENTRSDKSADLRLP